MYINKSSVTVFSLSTFKTIRSGLPVLNQLDFRNNMFGAVIHWRNWFHEMTYGSTIPPQVSWLLDTEWIAGKASTKASLTWGIQYGDDTTIRHTYDDEYNTARLEYCCTSTNGNAEWSSI